MQLPIRSRPSVTLPRALVLVLLALCALAACGTQGSTPPPTPLPTVTPTVDPQAAAAIALVEKSLDILTNRSVASNISIAAQAASPDLQLYSGPNPYPDIAYDASATSRAAILLHNSDPTRAAAYASYAGRLADYLVQHKDDAKDGTTGWGLPEAWDAFQDGTVNPPNTKYAFQTGLAGDALIDVYLATNNVTYLQTAEEAAATFLPLSTIKVDTKCVNCRYFWYSADSNDFGRLVKNTNMLLGSMYARLAAITQDPTYLTPAEQVFNTEQYEIATRANFHYLGYDDPKYSPTGTRDAHTVAEIWGLHDITISLAPLGFPAAANSLPLLTAMETFFWQCGATCSASLTTDYGVRAACELAPVDASSRQRCEQAISMYLAPGARWLPPYPTLGVLQHLTIFGYRIS